jgi:hypothetical protein
VSYLPIILGTNEISKDIINESSNLLRMKYWNKIHSYIIKYIKIKDIIGICGMSYYLRELLEKLEFHTIYKQFS